MQALDVVQLDGALLEKAEVPVLFELWRRWGEKSARQIIHHSSKAPSLFQRTEHWFCRRLFTAKAPWRPDPKVACCRPGGIHREGPVRLQTVTLLLIECVSAHRLIPVWSAGLPQTFYISLATITGFFAGHKSSPRRLRTVPRTAFSPQASCCPPQNALVVEEGLQNFDFSAVLKKQGK